jgi:protein tyrosine phosphatase (PTP) superfamily phosphohydrolase (DUF442 family)
MTRIRCALAGSLLVVAALGVPAAARDFVVTKVNDRMFHGPAPHTPEDYAQLKCLGVKTILEMRKFLPRQMSAEECAAHQYGFLYRHVPLGFRRDLDCSILQALAIIADPNMQPVFFHCNLGRDRVNLLTAVYRVRYEGWSPQAAHNAMMAGGYKSFLRKLDQAYWRLVRRRR